MKKRERLRDEVEEKIHFRQKSFIRTCARIYGILLFSFLCLFVVPRITEGICCSIILSITTSIFVCELLEVVHNIMNTSVDYQKGKSNYYAGINAYISQIEDICSREKLYDNCKAAKSQDIFDKGWNSLRIKVGELWKCAKQFADNDTVFIISREYIDSLRYILRMKTTIDLLFPTREYEILSKELFDTKHYETTSTKMLQEIRGCFGPDPQVNDFLSDQKIFKFEKLPKLNQRWSRVGRIDTIFEKGNDSVKVTEYYLVPAMELDAHSYLKESKYSYCKVIRMAFEQNDRGLAEAVYNDEVPSEADDVS